MNEQMLNNETLENNNISEVENPINNEVTENTDIDVESLTDEEKQAAINVINANIYKLAKAKLDEYGLKWTFRSINYILNTCNVSFGQLRSCVFVRDEQAYFDYFKATMLLIKAGLVGSKQYNENQKEELENKAYDIIEDFRETVGFVGTLHILIIQEMEEKHFFMGMADEAILTHLNSSHSVSDLVKNLLAEDLEEKMKQFQALRSDS